MKLCPGIVTKPYLLQKPDRDMNSRNVCKCKTAHGIKNGTIFY